MMTINIDIFSILIGAVIGIILQKIILVIVGPEIEYEISYRWNWFIKKVKDPKIDLSYYRVSEELTDTFTVSEIQDKVASILSKNNIGHTQIGNNIQIIDFEFGTTKYNGTIKFDYNSFEKGTLSRINLELIKPCSFSKFSEEILGIDNCANKLLETIRISLPSQITFHPFIKCKMNKIEKMVGVLSKLNKISKNNLFNYMYFSDRLKVEISSESVMLSDEIDATGIQLLKELVIMYY
jgi:hypothetical protein